MKGVEFKLDSSGQKLEMVAEPEKFESHINVDHIMQQIDNSEFHQFFIFTDKIEDVIERAHVAKTARQKISVELVIGETRPYQATVKIQEDNMAAAIVVEAPYGGRTATKEDFSTLLMQSGVKRGISAKQINYLVKQVMSAEAGESIEHIVARGLPVKHGKNSEIHPLVPNVLERILRPTAKDRDVVDMRDLGDIMTVKAGTPILKQSPPTDGRPGYDIFNTTLLPKTGTWAKLPIGNGTEICSEDSNILKATISGMPKFKNGKMWVDETFVCKGVNVGSGNVRYDGSVIVNGDVTEKMKITCTGDVTINGFVESATIEAGGDIIITQGAMGKVDEKAKEFSCTLKAKGNIHVQHGQGLLMECGNDISVAKQLAYSNITCGGSVTVGKIDNPNGNLFACDIRCQNSVRAGTLGAVSGSLLSIDFSGGYNHIISGQSSIDNLFSTLTENLASHAETIDKINNKSIPEEIQPKANLAMDIYLSEQKLLAFLQEKVQTLKDKKEEFIADIGLEAKKTLYPGVVVKLNNRSWRAEKEYSCAKIHYTNYQWQFDPLI